MPDRYLPDILAELDESLRTSDPPTAAPQRPAAWLARISEQLGGAGRAAWRLTGLEESAARGVVGPSSYPATFRARMLGVAGLSVQAATAVEWQRAGAALGDLRAAIMKQLGEEIPPPPWDLDELQMLLLRDVGLAARTAVLLARVEREEPGAEQALDSLIGGRDPALGQLRDECVDIAATAVGAAALGEARLESSERHTG